MSAPIAKRAATHTAKHAKPVEHKPRMQKAGKADRAEISPKHSDSGYKQTARDSKQLITFAAGKTKDAAVLSFDNKLAPSQKPIKSVVHHRHSITLQFWIGLIAILTDRTPANRNSNEQSNILVQLAAWTIVYAILFGITSTGQSAAKFSSSLGWLILGGLVMKQEYFRTKNNLPARFTGLTGSKTTNVGAAPTTLPVSSGGGGPTKKAE